MRKIISLLVSCLMVYVSTIFAQNDCVYIAGTVTYSKYAAYWKSGKLIKLAETINGAEARTIAVSGSDVHVGGFKNVASKRGGTERIATYWKNGVEIPLALEGNYYNDQPEIYAIKSVGSDIYMFVTQPHIISSLPSPYFYYYKNGKAVKINNSNHQLKSGGVGSHTGTNNEHFFVSANGDVYEIGSMADDYITGAYRVVYWKNGRLEKENASGILKDKNTDIQINSLFVTPSGDVYIAGTKSTRLTGSAAIKSTAFYLKNGKEVLLSYDAWNTYGKSIFVENGNVYVAGDECKTFSHFSAVYWKNGQKIILQNYDDINGYDATCTSIAVVYSTVYASGSHKGGVYWVNGKEVKLEGQASTQFGGMAVVKGGGCFNNTIITATSSNYPSSSNPGNQQQYSTSVAQGQNSMRNGDFTGAMQNYANAATTATTKSEKQLATGGAIISGVAGIADIFKKSAEEKRKREEEERLEQERLKKERELAEAKATEELESNWKLAKEYAAQKTIDGYKKAISLMLGYATADKLNGMALNTIGTWYGEINDDTNEMKWYQKASLKGNADAYSNLGIMYRDGEGVKANKLLAFYYFQQGCKSGSNNGCSNLKNIREVIKKEIEDSLNIKSTAFKANRVGDSYRDEKNYNEAKKYYQKAVVADSNYHWSSTELAKMYFDTSQLNNYDSAAMWYSRAINAIEVDTARQKDIGTKNWFDNSYTDMLFNYAYANRKINNGKLAIETYLKAVREGYTGAYTQVGVTYELGLGGIEKDWKLAAEYYEKDADKNSAKAMYYLGQLYEKGGPNLDASARLSKKWYKKACEKDKRYCKQ